MHVLHYKTFIYFLKQLEHLDFTIVSLLVATVIGLSTLTFYFYFGTVATESFEKMSESIFEMNWPRLPQRLQKHVILMIANMQNTLYYHGCQILVLEFGTFVRVRKKIAMLNLINIKLNKYQYVSQFYIFIFSAP